MICDCKKINFAKVKNLSYWEDKKITTDENKILNFLKKKNLYNKKILHIGIGNSDLAKKILKENIYIDGITISSEEVKLANSLKLKFYKVFLIDKHNSNLCKKFKKKYDFIIDNNLKSYTCCKKNFNFYFSSLCKLLKKSGIIITSKKGMCWYKKLDYKKSFKIRKLFFNKIKELDSSRENILSLKECKNLASVHFLKIIIRRDIVFFKK